jgi:hypothetical protein
MIRKRTLLVLVTGFILSACIPPVVQQTPQTTPSPLPREITPTPFNPPTALSPTASPTITLTPTPTFTPTPAYPPEGYGPSNFPENINPLTGLEVEDISHLNRRPVLVKVSNLPRVVRPQWGLSLADIVYEYYTEEGTTRFAAVFYGNDAEKVGSVRSARFFDAHLIRMYNAIFAFGSADYRVRYRLYNSEFANRLMLEWTAVCPAMCREAPGGHDFLFANTKELTAYAEKIGVEDHSRQPLDGMLFQMQPPGGAMGAASNVYTWYSSVIYNRWDYDPAQGHYVRFSDTENATTEAEEQYAQLTDALTGDPITADTLVVLFTPHPYYSLTPEIVDISLEGSGVAYVFRDGNAYQVLWKRASAYTPLTLVYEDGRPFPFKPGTTWFEVMGQTSEARQEGTKWYFKQHFP